MTILATYVKQPIDRLDYDFDYSQFLAGADSIESATFLVEPEGLTLDSTVVEPTFTKVWISGGDVGTAYIVNCTVTTAHGRIKQDEIKIRVKEF